MERYQSAAIASLVSQLKRGPKRLRLRQLLNIDFLMSVIEPGKSYPYDFVCHALTGYRAPSNGREARLIDGDGLVCDLVNAAEDLSADADIPITAWPGGIYSVAELAARFDVSTKTIFRWRRRGLVGWKFRFADRRLRVLFPERCVQRFVSQNAGLVQRGSTFSQLSESERNRIIDRSRELVAAGQRTVNAVARTISLEIGRAVETIRLVLKSYDLEHPAEGVFNRSAVQSVGDALQLAIWEAYADGQTIEALAERFDRPVAWVYGVVTRMRAREMKSRRIEFVPSAEFDLPDALERILHDPSAAALPPTTAQPPARVPADLPPYLQQLFRFPLLTPQREAALFRKFNFLKFRAAQAAAAIDVDSAAPAELDRIEDLLEQAAVVKNQITQANLRLVVSIAKKHTSPGVDLFELISDGNVSLMRAVEKFDYSRGFKFSTYASWAVMKNFARSIPEQRQQLDRYQTGRAEVFESVPGILPDDAESDQTSALRGALERMLAVLSAREREILRHRFGLDGADGAQTLEQVGKRVGVSKERIRQLEARAMARLRDEFQDEALRLLGA